MKRAVLHDPNFIGKRLRELRLYFGFTQSDIAKELGITRPTYTYYELGSVRVDPLILGKLADIYNVPVDLFYSDQPLDPGFQEVFSSPPSRTHHRGLDREPYRVGELEPDERALILFLRATGEFTCDQVLNELRARIRKKYDLPD